MLNEGQKLYWSLYENHKGRFTSHKFNARYYISIFTGADHELAGSAFLMDSATTFPLGILSRSSNDDDTVLSTYLDPEANFKVKEKFQVSSEKIGAAVIDIKKNNDLRTELMFLSKICYTLKFEFKDRLIPLFVINNITGEKHGIEFCDLVEAKELKSVWLSI